MTPVLRQSALACVLLVCVACKDTTASALAVPVDPVGLQLSTTPLGKVDPSRLELQGRRLGPRTLVVQGGDTLRRISTDEGESWADVSELPPSDAAAVFNGGVHLLRLKQPREGHPNTTLLHRTLDNPTESVALQYPGTSRGGLFNPALTALPDGLLGTFTLLVAEHESRLQALRWRPESGWTELGPIPGTALRWRFPVSLVSDARGTVYLAYIHFSMLDPNRGLGGVLDDSSLRILRSRDAGASWTELARDLGASSEPAGMKPRSAQKVQLFISPEGELTLFLQQLYSRRTLLLKLEEQEQLLMSRSTDGVTWSPLQRLEDADLKRSEEEPFATDFSQSPDGRTMALAWRDKRQGSTQLFLRVSRDGGKSWTAAMPVDPVRSVRDEPHTVLATDTGPVHLFWTGKDGTAHHTRAVLAQ